MFCAPVRPVSLCLSFALSAPFVAAMAVGCSKSNATSAVPLVVDAGADAGVGEGGKGADVLPATEYCESIVDFFCPFYMRCGRMVADGLDECSSVFLETCNARYEPRYADLEHAGLLQLSRNGIDACARHLSSVACDDQPLDLGGPCAGMWVGHSGEGAPCGFDVESFVCAEGTTCILGLDLCGTCQAKPKPDAGPPATIVGEGDKCDAKHRCAYRAFCSNGACVKSSMIGEPCRTDGMCASGRCNSGSCQALLADGAPCVASTECASGVCNFEGHCQSLPDGCFSK
jgi:hypothetical protein